MINVRYRHVSTLQIMITLYKNDNFFDSQLFDDSHKTTLRKILKCDNFCVIVKMILYLFSRKNFTIKNTLKHKNTILEKIYIDYTDKMKQSK